MLVKKLIFLNRVNSKIKISDFLIFSSFSKTENSTNSFITSRRCVKTTFLNNIKLFKKKQLLLKGNILEFNFLTKKNPKILENLEKFIKFKFKFFRLSIILNFGYNKPYLDYVKHYNNLLLLKLFKFYLVRMFKLLKMHSLN